MRFHFSAAALVLAIVGAAAAAPAEPRAKADARPTVDLKARIDELAQPLIDDEVLVGCVVGVIKDGKAQVLSYGRTRKGGNDKPGADTLYEIGSVTKVFTSVLLAEMAERGQVKLSDPVQSLLPARKVTVPLREKAITLEDLATHHSGLPRMPDNLKPADSHNPYADYSVEMMYAFLSAHKAERDPGASYEYSNLAAGLLGHALALKAGKEYEALIIERICKPLGMSDTCITLSRSQRKRLAPPYSASLEPAHNWDLPTLAGAGALRSSVKDMLLFLKANLAPSDDALGKALAATHEPRHKIAGGLSVGLGWHVARDGVTRVHNGQTGGYTSFAAFIPKAGIAVVVLANASTPRDASTLGEQVIQLATGMEVKPVVRRKAIEVDADTLKKYEGVYALAPAFFLTISVDKGRLMAQVTGQDKYPVYAESKTKFFYKVVDAQITFELDEAGEVKGLILHQGGRDLPAARQKK